MSSYQLAAHATAGLPVRCPKCDAEPLRPCISARTGKPRLTTHQERKPKDAA